MVFPRGTLRLTVLLTVMIVALLIYGIVRGDPYAYIMAGVLFVFGGLPALLLLVLNRAHLKNGPPDTEAPTQEEQRALMNGHHSPK